MLIINIYAFFKDKIIIKTNKNVILLIKDFKISILKLKKDLSDRDSSFIKNTIFNYGLKFFSIALNLLMIPLLLTVLGKEKFGVWQTVLVIISWVSILNFGLGNGLRNSIAKLNANDKKEEIGLLIGSTYREFTKIILPILLIILPTTYYLLNSFDLFVNTTVDRNEIRISILIFLFFFMINLILGLAASIAFGLQKSFLTGIKQLVYLFLCYLTIFIFSRNTDLNLIQISIIFGLLQSIVSILFLIYQNKKFDLKINFKAKYDLSDLMKLSLSFLIVQMLSLVFVSIDNFVISMTLGPNETAEFSIVNKMFFTLINLFSVLLIHFWNSVTDAFESKDFAWIKNAIKRLLKFSLIVFIIALGISFFHEEIIGLWLGKKKFEYSDLTFYLFSIYTLLHCVNAIFITIQNGAGILRLQMFSIGLMLLIYIVGSYTIDINHFGYNILIILKIVATSIGLFINLFAINILKRTEKRRIWN